ncbi:MAG: chromosome replication initiation inhibitor protein, partial [Massilia sp.]
AGHWFGDGFSAEAVALAPAVDSPRQLLARYLAQAWGIDTPFPHHTLPESAALTGCITDGVAYGLMPALQADALLAAGTLVELTPGKLHELALVWHAWNIDTPFTRTLSEHIIASARRSLPQA